MAFSYAAVKRLEGKYLVQTMTGESAKAPVPLYSGCRVFSNYPRKRACNPVAFYDAVSHLNSLPTPIMSAWPDSSVQLTVLIEWRQPGSLNATSARLLRFPACRIGINAGYSCAG